MKVKIKGLVFVGFAAAILSANAMAANEANTVTSQAYTEATYQHKSDRVVDWANKTNEEKTAALASDDLYPSMKTLDAEMDALTTAITTTGNAAQAKSDADFVVGNRSGSWTPISNAVQSNTTQLTTTSEQNGKVGLQLDVTNAGADINATDAGLTTGQAVHEYVTSTLTTNNHATYQPYEAAANKISGADGSWKALNSDVTDTAAAGENFDGDNAASTAAIRTYVQGKIVDSVAGDSTREAPSQGSVKTALATKENLSDKATAIVTSGDDANYNSTTKYASTKAVYDYVNSATGIAAMPAACATSPCALVTDSGVPTWVVIAQPANP